MRICGLDPSLTNTGIAILDCSSDLIAGERIAAPIALHSIGWGESGPKTYLDRMRRGRNLASSVMSYTLARKPDVIVIEAPIPQGLAGRQNQPELGWLFNLLLSECEVQGIPSVCVNPKIRQAWPTGNGNARKSVILEEVRLWYPGVKILNADIADGIVLALMAAHRLGYAMPFEPKDRHANLLDKIDWRELLHKSA